MRNKPRIYVADLADYNAGRLRGVWIDLAGKDKDAILAEIQSMLDEGTKEDPHGEVHEEWDIHDTEDLPYCVRSLEHIVTYVEALEATRYSAALKAYVEYYGIKTISEFEEQYQGTWETVQEYAENFLDSCYDIDKMLGPLAGYFDHEAYARDLEIGGDITAIRLPGGEVAIFNNN